MNAKINVEMNDKQLIRSISQWPTRGRNIYLQIKEVKVKICGNIFVTFVIFNVFKPIV